MTKEVEIITQYIQEDIGYDGPIDPSADLLEKKVIDSFSVVELAVFLEERFEVGLEPDDLTRENMSKVNSMVALIQKRRTN